MCTFNENLMKTNLQKNSLPCFYNVEAFIEPYRIVVVQLQTQLCIVIP